MVVVRMVQVTVVQIVGMAVMPHGRVTATRPVAMGMVRMRRSGTGSHRVVSSLCPGSADTAVRPPAACSMALRINGSTCSSARA